MYQERVTQFWDICSIKYVELRDKPNADNHFATP